MTQNLDAFREEARQWLQDNFPPALKNRRPPGIAGFAAKAATAITLSARAPIPRNDRR